MYRTIPVKAKFTEEEKAFWVDQCEHANSLINCAIYHTKQTHYSKLEELGNAFTTYWRGDELRYGWKTYKCYKTYPELDKVLKENPHYKAMAAQSAQQTLKSVGESIVSYNGLVNLYYGIVLIITEEAYTSKASYLDGDSLYKFGEKPAGWKPSAQRVKRGLYKSRNGHIINADCNGSANIMRKVATQLGLNLVEVGRASLTVPQRIDLFNRLSKSHRQRSEASCLWLRHASYQTEA